MAKTWHEKLAGYADLPKINPIPERMRKRSGDGTIVIPHPHDVVRTMERVRKSRLATIPLLSEAIAREQGATIGCTVTIGIFAWMAANAAHDDEAAGKSAVTPYWRVLKAGGEINVKYPGGIEVLMNRLESEGHTVVQKGDKYFVEDYAKSMERL